MTGGYVSLDGGSRRGPSSEPRVTAALWFGNDDRWGTCHWMVAHGVDRHQNRGSQQHYGLVMMTGGYVSLDGGSRRGPSSEPRVTAALWFGNDDRWVRVTGWWLTAWTVIRTAGHSSTMVW